MMKHSCVASAWAASALWRALLHEEVSSEGCAGLMSGLWKDIAFFFVFFQTKGCPFRSFHQLTHSHCSLKVRYSLVEVPRGKKGNY